MNNKESDQWLWNYVLEVGAEYANSKARHASRYDDLKAKFTTELDRARVAIAIPNLPHLQIRAFDRNTEWASPIFDTNSLPFTVIKTSKDKDTV
jgi:hypothetical protein